MVDKITSIVYNEIRKKVRDMSIGQNIAARRKQLKLSQEYIANQLGVSRQSVSKWETGQTEPTTKNLVELAHLFDISVSELVEPEKAVPAKAEPEMNWKLGLRRFAIIGYSGSAVLYTIETNDPLFPVFATVMIGIFALWMAINILLLPATVRLKKAIAELCYCVLICSIVLFLEPVIRNVLTSILITICCVIYITRVRFQEETT